MKKITNLQAAMKPLTEGIDPPVEQLPEPEYIDVSQDEYNRMMQFKINASMQAQLKLEFFKAYEEFFK